MADHYERLMAKARKTNASYDRIDGGELNRVQPIVLLQTVDEAIAAGIKMQNWDCVAEGLDMLREKVIEPLKAAINA